MKYLFILSFILLWTYSNAQYSEFGVSLGMATYSGELNQYHGVIPSEYNAAFGIFGRHNFGRKISGKISLTKGQITSTDANSTDPL